MRLLVCLLVVLVWVCVELGCVWVVLRWRVLGCVWVVLVCVVCCVVLGGLCCVVLC